MSIFTKIFGSNEREIRKLQPIVEKINSFESEIIKLNDEELRFKTDEFRERLKKGETLDEILPEAFAVVREAANRVIGERHYDVQLIGGIVLHQGKIAEMKTGEGKTLVATLPVYLNAISGDGAHVITVNDYLARRDCNWMGSIYNFLGLKTACIVHDQSFIYEPKILDSDSVTVEVENLKEVTRREAYQADITYGTNNEFGFDYLRDNMVQSLDDMAQRDPNFAIVDEVDSILIDEARTPLIISAPDSQSTKLYEQFAQIVPRLKEKEHYEVDEKMKSVILTEKGIAKVESLLGVGNIYESGKINYVHHLEQALKAEVIFKLDRDYVVKEGEVIIVDDFTGRMMHGRRYSEGLHQAIEAKEGVKVQRESKTLATITFQNYFRMYKKLSGMTGTAMTSAEEFFKVYKLESLEIPTNKAMIRKDYPDVVYKTEEAKYKAIFEKIKSINKTGQPVLVGTIAIEKSEYLSALLAREGVKHEVLNAKNHEKEAVIIATAGQKGSVTIATNMAGRGTDIKLGDGVKDLGGLFIIGTERHEARRIDNQLRGRAGRQGDPGASQFYVSLEDELLRRFGGDKMKSLMNKLGIPDDEPIENSLISRTIENAQSKIEGYNFDIRKHVLDYDDVMNKQREVVYKKRKNILKADDTKNEILNQISEEAEKILALHCVGEDRDWDIKNILAEIRNMFFVSDDTELQLSKIRDDRSKDEIERISRMKEYILELAKGAYHQKENEIGAPTLRQIEKAVILQAVDSLWMNHLDEIDYLRQGIGLRGYGQRDPLIEYKREAFNLFSHLMDSVRQTVVRTIFRVSVSAPQKEEKKNLEFKGASDEIKQFESMGKSETSDNAAKSVSKPIVNKNVIGRNDLCPCGSGKKYKRCGMLNTTEHQQNMKKV